MIKVIDEPFSGQYPKSEEPRVPVTKVVTEEVCQEKKPCRICYVFRKGGVVWPK